MLLQNDAACQRGAGPDVNAALLTDVAVALIINCSGSIRPWGGRLQMQHRAVTVRVSRTSSSNKGSIGK